MNPGRKPAHACSAVSQVRSPGIDGTLNSNPKSKTVGEVLSHCIWLNGCCSAVSGGVPGAFDLLFARSFFHEGARFCRAPKAEAQPMPPKPMRENPACPVSLLLFWV